MRFHRLYDFASCRFFEFFGGMLFEKCKGRALCKKGCYTVLYNACIHVLCTRYTRVIRMCITLRMDTLYTVAHNNYSITLCITSV